MAGHGSPPPDDRANDPARRVTRDAYDPHPADLLGGIDQHPEEDTAAYHRRLGAMTPEHFRRVGGTHGGPG